MKSAKKGESKVDEQMILTKAKKDIMNILSERGWSVGGEKDANVLFKGKPVRKKRASDLFIAATNESKNKQAVIHVFFTDGGVEEFQNDFGENVHCKSTDEYYIGPAVKVYYCKNGNLYPTHSFFYAKENDRKMLYGEF